LFAFVLSRGIQIFFAGRVDSASRAFAQDDGSGSAGVSPATNPRRPRSKSLRGQALRRAPPFERGLFFSALSASPRETKTASLRAKRSNPENPIPTPALPLKGRELHVLRGFAPSREAVFMDCFVAFAPRNDADFFFALFAFFAVNKKGRV
jgi:hypothetical protein